MRRKAHAGLPADEIFLLTILGERPQRDGAERNRAGQVGVPTQRAQAAVCVIPADTLALGKERSGTKVAKDAA